MGVDSGGVEDASDTDASDAPEVEDSTQRDVSDVSDATADTGDCTADCDYDGLSDCDERDLGTEPCNLDSDGDGLNDSREVIHGTDPLAADSDGDGVGDADELAVGLDPTKESTLADGTPDGERWIVGACDEPEAEALSTHASAGGLFRIALARGFSEFANLQLDSAITGKAASVFSDPSNEVAGFVFSREISSQAVPEEINADLVRTLSQVGTIIQDFQGTSFRTHLGQPAARSEFLIEASASTTPSAFRDQALFAFAPFGAPDVLNLPGTTGADYEQFRLFFSTVVHNRTGQPPRAITTASVAPQQKYTAREHTRFRLVDVTDTTNLSFPNDAFDTRCRTSAAGEKQKVDFYWVLDFGGSMSGWVEDVSQIASRLVTRLEETSLDFRLGVTSMSRAQEGRLHNPPGWHTDAATLQQETAFESFFPHDPEGRQWPFEATYKAITYMKGLDGGNPAPEERIRPDAQLVTIFMTNDQPNDTHTPSLVLQPIEFYLSFLQEHTTAFALIGGQIPDCIDSSFYDWTAYLEAARRTGGGVGSVCVIDVEETIDQIIDQAHGDTSPYVLPDVPISSTLRVYVDGQWVPRSRQDGFDYSPENNALTFYGTYRPFLHTDNRQVHSVSIHYKRWKQRIKEDVE